MNSTPQWLTDETLNWVRSGKKHSFSPPRWAISKARGMLGDA
jgi:hypothetical protein